jgi:drug/metabolite transporter (DMT)-like permease
VSSSSPAPDRRSWIELHAAVLLFGLAGVIGKGIHLSPGALVFGRTAFAALALWALLLMRRRKPSASGDPALVGLLVAGGVLAFHWVAFFQAVQVASVAVALLTFSSFPLWVTLLEPLVFREPFRRRDLVTAGLVTCGLVLIVPQPDLRDRVTLGALWGTLSGLSFAVLALLNRGLARRYGPVQLAAGENLTAAAALLPLVLLERPRPSGSDLLLLLVLGVLCTAVAHALFIGSLGRIRAQVASVVTSLEVVYGTVFAALWFGEVPSVRTLLGGAVILSGVVLASYRSKSGPN